jgi:lipopolysaccharide assembly protein A
MQILRIAFWALVAACLVTVGLANRGLVTLRVLPEALGNAVGVSPDIAMPLFLVILIGFGLGMVVGLIWEWIREIPERAAARAQAREIERLRAEVARLSGTKLATPAAGGDVLALIDAPAQGALARR